MAIKDKDGVKGTPYGKTKHVIKRKSNKASVTSDGISVRRVVLTRDDVKKTPELFNFEKPKREAENKLAESVFKDKPAEDRQPRLDKGTVSVKKNPPKHNMPEALRPHPSTGTSSGKSSLRSSYKHSAAKPYNVTANNEAKKQYRHELKYYINMRDYRVLLSAAQCALFPDENSIEGGYHVRSLYFDDLYDRALREKISGVNSREKYRIRIYNKSDSIIRLERKEKIGEYIAKESLPLTRDEFERILSNDIEFLLEKKSILAHDFFAEIKFKGLSPKVVVDYFRKAFVYPIEDVRVTFDLNLRSGMFNKNIFDKELLTMPVYEKGIAILEIKYNKFLPLFIKGIINTAEGASRSAISKYLICRKYE
ncbi:MAG: polyphosphate polymerase domain-containing protein [Eubacteriales bacterium]